jgi:hypothetical protein
LSADNSRSIFRALRCLSSDDPDAAKGGEVMRKGTLALFVAVLAAYVAAGGGNGFLWP